LYPKTSQFSSIQSQSDAKPTHSQNGSHPQGFGQVWEDKTFQRIDKDKYISSIGTFP
jgi:hypothetical protein